jgi:hypothetical protein
VYVLFYLIGLFLVAGATGYGVHLIGLGQEWLLVIAAFVFGIGLIGLAKHRR